LGLPCERRSVDVVDRSDRPELLGGLNPALRVPTLILDDGRPLAESNAILWYFGEGTRFVPDDRYERAQVLQWQFFEQYDHEPSIAVVRFWIAYSGRPEAFADRLEERKTAGHRALGAALAQRQLLVVVERDHDLLALGQARDRVAERLAELRLGERALGVRARGVLDRVDQRHLVAARGGDRPQLVEGRDRRP